MIFSRAAARAPGKSPGSRLTKPGSYVERVCLPAGRLWA